jgi:hypothetical protein
MEVNPAKRHLVILKVVFDASLDEHRTGLLHAIPLPFRPPSMHLPQATAARQTVITSGPATVWIGERTTGMPCRKGSRPVVYSGRMARAEEESQKGRC